MSKSVKRTVRNNPKNDSKNVILDKLSTDNDKSIWLFDMLDKSGIFAFNIHRDDFNSTDILEKIILYSNLSWAEIKRQTHDDGKSKHHFLDTDVMSDEAIKRISALKFEDRTDQIFSFALTNKIRIIGLRDKEFFTLFGMTHYTIFIRRRKNIHKYYGLLQVFYYSSPFIYSTITGLKLSLYGRPYLPSASR